MRKSLCILYTLGPSPTTFKFRKKNRQFTAAQVDLAFRSFNNNKAPGSDGLPPETLKNLDNDTLERIAILYEACYEISYRCLYSVLELDYVPIFLSKSLLLLQPEYFLTYFWPTVWNTESRFGSKIYFNPFQDAVNQNIVKIILTNRNFSKVRSDKK